MIARFLSRFRRVTTSGNFIAEIDGLRFIAIGTVVLFHLMVGLSIKSPTQFAIPHGLNILKMIGLQGYHGVELFFIISGFILAYPFASHLLKGKRPVNLKSYFLRRVTRLEPPYILCMLFMYVLRVSTKGANSEALFPHLMASLGYLHNIIYGSESPINNVAWSLEIEIQFYILVPLLSFVFAIQRKSLRRAVLLAACGVSVIVSLFISQPGNIFYLTIARFLHFFLIGFLLADVYLMDWQERPAKKMIWDWVSFVGWPLLIIVWNMPSFVSTSLSESVALGIQAFSFPVLAFFLYMAVFRGPLTNWLMTKPLVTTIGGMCYSIYLFHNPVMGVIESATRSLAPTHLYSLNLLLQMLIVLPLMLIPTGTYFLLIEKPCMRRDWPKRLYGKIQRFAREGSRGVTNSDNPGRRAWSKTEGKL